jgi:predicted RNA binding protein YcfA (HicA-like mRNA interferase family)
MGRLAGFHCREVLRVAESFGWTHVRTNGDHFIYKKAGVPRNIAIPDHRPIREGTLRDIVKVRHLGR